MTKFQWRMAIAAGGIAAVFAGLVIYALRTAPRMAKESEVAINSFYRACQQENYPEAETFIGQNLREVITPKLLKKTWADFKSKHGTIKSWRPANNVSITGFGGSVCVYPPFVEYRHGVQGTKGTGTLIYIRMAPENGKWKLERLNFLR